MHRHRTLPFLIFVFFFGCYSQPEIPVDIWLDSRWDQDEQDAIIHGMERLEEATGLNFFNFVGEFEDGDGEFTMEDIADGRHVVYKAMVPNDDLTFLEREEVEYLGKPKARLRGYGLHSDVILLWYNFGPKYDEDERDDYLVSLSNLITHEADHFLGPGHNRTVECDESLMTPSGCTPRGEYREITEEDVAQLCVFYREYGCPHR